MIKTRAIAAMILIAAVLVGSFVYYSQVYSRTAPTSTLGHFSFKLGLDLAGGSHLVYQADLSQIPATEAASSMLALQNVISRRVNAFGVSEPLVEVQGGNQLIVELPGVTDISQAIANIGQTPVLEFKVLTAKEQQILASTTATMTAAEQASTTMAAFQPIGLTGRMLQSAALNFDSTSGAPVVSLNFNAEGTALFASTTKANIGNIIGIFLDGDMISAPVVQEPILNGQAQISGNFTVSAAQELVRNLNYGALPVPITLVSTETIGASLGQSAVQGGIDVGIISFIIIGAFLIIWYRLPGVVAVCALGVYTAIMLALFKLIPVTLTAAGIAGFIITIGMAVDANILIFERMKEELRKGSPLAQAMHEGFARAWPSIRDSNTSSIITGIILYYFGSTSVVTGFALVFVIGVLVSMFTAISASRMFLYVIAPKNDSKVSRFLFSNGFHFRKSATAAVVTPAASNITKK
jgi:protein-export membrane protein SecD